MKQKLKSFLLRRPLTNGTILGLVLCALFFPFAARALFFTFNPLTVLATNAATTWPPSGYPLCQVATVSIPSHTIQVTSSNVPVANIILRVKFGVDGTTYPMVITNFSFVSSNDTEFLVTPATNLTIYGALEIDTTNDAYNNQLFGATIIN